MTEPPRPLRSPLRVAIYTFLIVVGCGLVAGGVIAAFSSDRDDHYERGQRFGRGLAPLAVISAGIAYFIQDRRRK